MANFSGGLLGVIGHCVKTAKRSLVPSETGKNCATVRSGRIHSTGSILIIAGEGLFF